MEGRITAKEAAHKLGYNYEYFMKLLKAGKVERADYWSGYVLPEDISKEDVLTGGVGRPKKESGRHEST